MDSIELVECLSRYSIRRLSGDNIFRYYCFGNGGGWYPEHSLIQEPDKFLVARNTAENLFESLTVKRVFNILQSGHMTA